MKVEQNMARVATSASVACTAEGSKFDNLAIVDWTMKELAALVAALSFLMIFMQTILLVSKSKHCTSEDSPREECQNLVEFGAQT